MNHKSEKFSDILFPSNYNDTKLSRKIKEFLEKVEKTNASDKNNINILYTDGVINQFVRINSHAKMYLNRDNKYCEIPDEKTALLFGYKRIWGSVPQIQLPNDKLKNSLGKPLASVTDSKVWKERGKTEEIWLIYDGVRHLTNLFTMNYIYGNKDFDNLDVVVENTTIAYKGDLYNYIQGDEFDLTDYINSLNK